MPRAYRDAPLAALGLAALLGLAGAPGAAAARSGNGCAPPAAMAGSPPGGSLTIRLPGAELRGGAPGSRIVRLPVSLSLSLALSLSRCNGDAVAHVPLP